MVGGEKLSVLPNFYLMVDDSAAFLEAYSLILLGSIEMSGEGEASLGYCKCYLRLLGTTVLFKASQLPLSGSAVMGRQKGTCLFQDTASAPLRFQSVI